MSICHYISCMMSCKLYFKTNINTVQLQIYSIGGTDEELKTYWHKTWLKSNRPFKILQQQCKTYCSDKTPSSSWCINEGLSRDQRWRGKANNNLSELLKMSHNIGVQFVLNKMNWERSQTQHRDREEIWLRLSLHDLCSGGMSFQESTHLSFITSLGALSSALPKHFHNKTQHNVLPGRHGLLIIRICGLKEVLITFLTSKRKNNSNVTSH